MWRLTHKLTPRLSRLKRRKPTHFCQTLRYLKAEVLLYTLAATQAYLEYKNPCEKLGDVQGYNTLADTLPEEKANILGDTFGNKLGNGEAKALLDNWMTL